MTDEVARFQAEIRRIAFAIARTVIEQELDRKRATLDAARPRVELPAPRPPAAALAPAVVPTREPAPAPPAAGHKRVPWTREAIINELATWMSNGTVIDAPFVTRYGPPGLVAATRRVFGRFEAALNVVALHVSKLHPQPEGPPTRRDMDMRSGADTTPR